MLQYFPVERLDLVSVPLQNKCTRYWSDPDAPKQFGKIHLVLLKETTNPHYILRAFLVHNEEDEVGRQHSLSLSSLCCDCVCVYEQTQTL